VAILAYFVIAKGPWQLFTTRAQASRSLPVDFAELASDVTAREPPTEL